MQNCIRIPSEFLDLFSQNVSEVGIFSKPGEGITTSQLADQCRRWICFPESVRTAMRRCTDMNSMC